MSHEKTQDPQDLIYPTPADRAEQLQGRWTNRPLGSEQQPTDTERLKVNEHDRIAIAERIADSHWVKSTPLRVDRDELVDAIAEGVEAGIAVMRGEA